MSDNPGGSIGDPRMSLVPPVPSLESLLQTFETDFGYDSSHARLFRKYTVGRKVADLGCGHGFSTFYLSVNAKETVGFDVDPEGIGFANSLVRRFGSVNVSFHLFDGGFTGYSDGYFQVVVSSDVIEHTNSPKVHLGEAFRLCAREGLLLLSTPNGLISNGDPKIIRSHSVYHVTEYSPSQLGGLVQESGFDIERTFRQIRTRKKTNAVQDFVTRIVLLRNNVLGAERVSIFNRMKFLYRLKKNLKMTDGITSYELIECSLRDITSSNCDAIVVVARKK